MLQIPPFLQYWVNLTFAVVIFRGCHGLHDVIIYVHLNMQNFTVANGGKVRISP